MQKRLAVAPLTGSVDRNEAVFVCPVIPAKSLPSRGAWIEIMVVAASAAVVPGRSPHGERG